MNMKYIINNLYICIVFPAKKPHIFQYSEITKSMSGAIKIRILYSRLKEIINTVSFCWVLILVLVFLWESMLCHQRLFIALSSSGDMHKIQAAFHVQEGHGAHMKLCSGSLGRERRALLLCGYLCWRPAIVLLWFFLLSRISFLALDFLKCLVRSSSCQEDTHPSQSNLSLWYTGRRKHSQP